MELIIICLLFGIATSLVTQTKGRSGCGGFLLGCVLGPIGLIIALVMPREAPAKPTDERPCPYCAEMVKKSAIKCRHCGSEINAWE